MKNSISYIIPCYNCSDTIEDTLLSIIESNLEAEDEIILVDDGSTDNTYAKLTYFHKKYNYIKIYKHNINKGSAAAGRNTGIDLASNDLIFCLDSDNILYPDSIKQLKLYLITHKLDAAAFGRIDYFTDATLEVIEYWEMTEKLNFIDALNDPMKTPCGSGNILYTKAIWKKVGRYNESLGGAYDSEIFGLKLLAEGAKFWTLPGTAYLHRKGHESTFCREYNKKNSSLLFLAGLIDYWNQVHKDDLEYIFGKGRLIWMDNLSHRPLRRPQNQPENRLKRYLKKIGII